MLVVTYAGVAASKPYITTLASHRLNSASSFLADYSWLIVFSLFCLPAQVGFFATKSSVAAAYPSTLDNPADWGVFYGGEGYQLGVQVLAVVVISIWSLGISFLLFGTLRALGWLRVSAKDEERGLDHAQGIGTGVNLLCPCL